MIRKELSDAIETGMELLHMITASPPASLQGARLSMRIPITIIDQCLWLADEPAESSLLRKTEPCINLLT
jgi:hypothetical protein